MTGEEAHQRLLPQPHVPSGAPRQPRGGAHILRPRPVLPRPHVSRHRGRLGLFLTAVSSPPDLNGHKTIKAKQ